MQESDAANTAYAQARAGYDNRVQELYQASGDMDLAKRLATQEVEEFAEKARTADKAVSDLENAIGDCAAAGDAAAGSFDAWGNSLSNSVIQTLNLRTNSQNGVGKLKEDLESLGVSVTDLSTLGESELLELADAYDESASSIIDVLTKYGVAMDGAAADTAKNAASMKSAIDGWGIKLNGIDISTFTQKLAEAGVSTETLNSIGSENLEALAESCNGNMAVMIWAIQNYNATPLLDKDGTVHLDDTELIDANGNVVVWNGTDLVYKETGAVVNDASLLDAQGNVWTWNGSDLTNKDGYAVISGNLPESNVAIDKYKNTPDDLGTKTGTVNIFENIVKSVSDFFSGNAAGGIRLNAAGGIRYHAGGAVIAHKAVPLDIVGEDGAEAIVPLTNRRYSQPFVDLIAEGVRNKTAAENNYYTVNNLDYLPDSRVASAVEELFSALAQTRKMVGRTA